MDEIIVGGYGGLARHIGCHVEVEGAVRATIAAPLARQWGNRWNGRMEESWRAAVRRQVEQWQARQQITGHTCLRFDPEWAGGTVIELGVRQA